MASISPKTLRGEVLERTHILEEILAHVDEYATQFDKVDYSALKDEILKPVIAENFNPEIQIRGFLRTFRHTLAYQAALSKISSPDLKTQIDQFVAGKRAKEVVGSKEFSPQSHPSPGVTHHFSLLTKLKELLLNIFELKAAIKDVLHPKHKHVKNLPILYEDARNTEIVEVRLCLPHTAVANKMKCYSDVPFENWGQTVQSSPMYTFLPTTVKGVQSIVEFAIQNKYRVRCAGYRHSWSPIFSQSNEVFISFVNLDTVTTLPDPVSLIPGNYDPTTVPELKTIELKEETVPGKKRLCRIGAAVTNEEFRRWSVAGKAWALPADVILVEVTIGGVNGPICHGAGISHKTLSDYVRRIEYIDCNGKHRTVDDRYLIKAAAGAFGLLGVVTHITFELDAMTYAVMVSICSSPIARTFTK
jgi:hypothetical protein